MKVMHLLYSNCFGGAEKVAMDLMTISNPFVKSIYVSKEGKISEHLKSRGLEYHLVDKFNYFELKNIVKRNKIDVIHAHDFKASIMANLLGVKVISHIHQEPKWINKMNLNNFLYGINTIFFSHIVVTSNNLVKQLNYTNKVVLLNNFVDVPDEFYSTDRKMKRFDFIFVGRLEKEKNPMGFVDFVQQMNNYGNFSAAIVGDGTEKNTIESYIKKYHLDIKLFGFQKNPYVLMSKSNFLVNTSEREGFGLVIIEAMQMGVPVISGSNIGGVSTYFNASNHINIEFPEESFAKKIKNIINNDNLYGSLSKNSYDLGVSFKDTEKIYRTLFEVYND
ncbi:glycosyltransferase [Vagococcus vulneris]|uniref:Glycosyl transferase family 1 domain-containing protein n=1 Tax=Vagococcus vulneris TaxID=1977869 RepID=A0A429ZZU0_9ENTE|nr:glycosyltransferase [Vagococcus vulneris]RST99570.1 hypothetical protein CBF37_04380 [Vagococcus vulneris]